ncbi:MarR family winged helix-turn-helix transcriptional regulator [Kitasatospora sp. NPDC015120]|uniref:MarR family winged helix-turn-helix transcriptional regulator n=1 Tax=Kitasatospora sp. NPDC015120 TaxID=3364023 RepID=UPI0036F46CC7
MDRDEPRWLSASELEAWKAFSAMIIKLPAALDAQLRADAGLNQFEYLVLAGLSDAPDRTLRMSDLAVLANGSLSRLSHVVTRLEGQGYVRRERCPGDGRATNAVLTEDGFRKLASSAPGHVEQVRSLVVDPLDAEQLEQLRRICLQVLQAMDPGLSWPPSGC